MSSRPINSITNSDALKQENRKHYFANMALGVDAVIAHVAVLMDKQRWRAWWKKRHRGGVKRVARRRIRNHPVRSKQRSQGVFATLSTVAYRLLPVSFQPSNYADVWSILFEKIRFHRWLNSNRNLFSGVRNNHSVVLFALVYALHHADRFNNLQTVVGRSWFKQFVVSLLQDAYPQHAVHEHQHKLYDQELDALNILLTSNYAHISLKTWRSVWEQIAEKSFVSQVSSLESNNSFSASMPVSSELLDFESTRAEPMFTRVNARNFATDYLQQGEDAQEGTSTKTPLSSFSLFAPDSSDRTSQDTSHTYTPSDGYGYNSNEASGFGDSSYRNVPDQDDHYQQVKPVQKPLYEVFSRSEDEMQNQPIQQPYVAVGEGNNVEVFTSPMPLWSPFLVRHFQREPSPLRPTFWFHGGDKASLSDVCNQVKDKLHKLQEPPNCVHILHNNRHIELTQLHVYRQFLSKQEYSQLDELRRILNITNEIKMHAAPSMTPVSF